MKLIVVRHGQTAFNLEERYLGALDPDLNANGISQAQAIAPHLPARPDVVISSPLRRARQTADIVCAALGVQAGIDPAFRERDVGVYEGLTRQEAEARFPELWARNVTRRWHEAPPGGESISAVCHRVHAGLVRVVARHGSATVLLVAHGFVAKVLRALSGAGLADFHEWQLKNGQSLVLQIDTAAALLSPARLDAQPPGPPSA